ncbi:MAG: hypothetical protein AAGM38_17450 [Pseudomonadota bacterium]
MAFFRKRVSRRSILSALGALAIGAPVARYAQLLWLDRSLPPVTEPELVFVNGWALDASDIAPRAASSGAAGPASE